MKKAFKSVLSLLLCMIMIIGTLIPTIAAKGNDSSQAAIEQDGLRLESTNAVGKVLAKAASEQVESSESYGIVGVDINGSTIAVEINNADACTVLVAVYDDDSGRMVGSGFCNVEQNAGNVDVELNISSLPDYYLLRAFLLDDELASLCEEYRDIEHTHNFIEAKEKTVDDFPDNIVLNLDETKDNNFAVVADNGVEITTDGVKNVLISSENDVYEFNNIDSQFDSLKDGDVISYTDGDKSSFVIKISAINIQGDKAIINSDTDASIDELFDFLKVDVGSDGDGEKMSVDMDGVEDGITYEGMEKFDETPRQSPAKAPQKSMVDVSSTLDCPVWNISKKFGYTGDGSGIGTGEASIEFKLQIKVGISYSLKAYYDADWEWKWDFWNSLKTYYYFESTFDFSAKATGSVTGKLSKEFYLGAIDFVTPCGITCGIGFRLVFAATGSISLDIQKYSFKIGFRYDNESGFRNLSSKPEKEVMPSLSGEISVSLSLKASPNISLIKIVEVAINPEAGIRITGVPLSINPVDVITGKPDESKVHTCSLCIDGSIKLFYTVSVSGRIFAKKASITLVSTQEWTVAKFYYSASTGKLEFGKTCPNILYCVTFTVVGKDGKALEGASVNIGDGALYKFENGKPVKVGGKVAVTDDKGVAKAYYANGKHTATASKDNSEYSVSFTVMNAEKELKVKLNVSGTNPNPNPGGDTDPTPTPGILDKLTYEIENGKVTITDCDTSLSGDIVLPSKIYGKPVTSIGYRAFYNCSSLTSITIPNSVTSIGYWAFKNTAYYNSSSNWEGNVLYINNALIEAKSTVSGAYSVKNGTTVIADQAFYGCRSLTSITIPDGVTSIGDWAFRDCSSLASITIPDSVTSIGDWAFKNTAYYNSSSNWEGNVLYINNALIEAKSTVSGAYSVKNGTTVIADQAFYGCRNLTSITIPNSVTSIGDWAFEDCSSLTSVAIPDSVTSIGSAAFSGCSSLTSVTIPDSVTSIGWSAFSGCSSLTSITIPDSVTSIDNHAFDGCSKLNQINVDTANTVYSSENGVLFDKDKTELIRYPEGKADTSYFIPNSVTSIGYRAFLNCSSLTSVTIPDSVTSIGSAAFDGCSSLTSVTIPDSVTSIGSAAFDGCSSLTSVTIPDGVTSIGDSAFAYCSSLTSVAIPNSVTSIGDWAFRDCSSLKDVYYSGTQEQWEKIGIGIYNDYLTNATIHYGSSAPAANAKAMRAPAAPAAQSTVYTATAQNAVPGELYMLYAFSSGTDLSSLEYVAQLRADSGEVKFRYIPRNSGELNVIIVGKFAGSNAKLSIKSPSTTTVSYGFTLNLHANVTDLPEGARIVWSMDGSGFELIPSADGMTCGVKSVSKGSATITAKVVDKNGNAVKDANGNEITASQQLTSKAGFFQKLVAFFKKLFGSNMIIPYALECIVK